SGSGGLCKLLAVTVGTFEAAEVGAFAGADAGHKEGHGILLGIEARAQADGERCGRRRDGELGGPFHQGSSVGAIGPGEPHYDADAETTRWLSKYSAARSATPSLRCRPGVRPCPSVRSRRG